MSEQSQNSESHPDAQSAQETLYCLDPQLLECLQQALPGWLTKADLEHERYVHSRCSRHSTVGFFYQLPIQDLTLTRSSSLEYDEETLNEWKELLNPAQVRTMSSEACERADPLVERLEAYRGWLVTNPRYLDELDQLRQRWQQVINELRFIPGQPVRLRCQWIVDEQASRAVTPEFIASFEAFYDRWELRQLSTWDLPQPRGANLSGIPFPPSVAVPSSAISIHMSPVLSLPANYPLQKVMEEIQASHSPPHLSGWLQVQRQQHDGDLRFLRFRRIFQLSFWRDVVLASRYHERMAGHVEALDRAFGMFMGNLSADSVKKLRLQMKRLRFA